MAARHHRLKHALAVLALLSSAGCATVAQNGHVSTDTEAPDTMSAAGASLLLQGRAEREAGENSRAALTLERAIRIEPNRPEAWLELARVRLDEGNFTQAEQLGRKARSLAAPETPLADSIAAVIGEAQRRQR